MLLTDFEIKTAMHNQKIVAIVHMIGTKLQLSQPVMITIAKEDAARISDIAHCSLFLVLTWSSKS